MMPVFTVEGVRDVETVVNHGPEADRWNLVVLGDGYTEDDIEKFERDVTAFVDELHGTAPFGKLWERINIHRITTLSAERAAGSSAENGEPAPNTIFGGKFNSELNGEPVPRLLTVDHKAAREVAHTFIPETHQVLVLFNSDIYGGGGGPVAVCSTGPDAFKIAIHEIGHSAFGLGDEYDTGDGRRPPNEPAASNITKFKSADKWKRHWTSDPALLVLHPDNDDFDPNAPAPPAAAVGAFEGALYVPLFMYRPSASCRMRELADDFCAVCQEAIRVKLSGFGHQVDALRTLNRITEGNTMLDLTPDEVPGALGDEPVVSLEGYVVDAEKQDEIELITDLWLRDRLVINRGDVIHRIPGTDRSSNGQSVLWVKRDAPLRRVVDGTAEEFASGDPDAGNEGDVGGWSPPPPPWPRR